MLLLINLCHIYTVLTGAYWLKISQNSTFPFVQKLLRFQDGGKVDDDIQKKVSNTYA